MHHSFYLFLPLALAATPVMALEVLTSDAKRSAIAAEARYRILIRVAGALTILLVVSSLMTFHPELGAIIAEYNQFS
ncbi:hypothetical protein JQ631_13115 [Bradyrhizobium manausense]|jgi:hypothetical protein|uniref:hypothetical protein n=1 Tax=Bradyrhizobium manausense TaxID=989370 RepID=UPI001BA97A66|nr:hypothetical protein [Bradyrhizobium manausense]MBR0790012.1 hypothetical protein [Bradyrhizobium manausense]